VVDVHQVLRRAGYAAHVVHENLLTTGGILSNYKTLVIVGQTHELPTKVREALTKFVKDGGKILVDRSTTVKLDGAVIYDGDFSAADVRRRAYQEQQQAKAAKTKREASVFSTSNYYNQFHRAAVPGLKAALAKTASRPVFVSNDPDLVGERHSTVLGDPNKLNQLQPGEGMLYMVLNGHEKTPDVANDKPIPTYNYAPATAAFTLQGIPKGSVVYCIEGLDWKKVSKVEKFDAPITANFAAGEMKLYLVAPRPPAGLDLKGQDQIGALKVEAQLQGIKMPWPFTVTVTAPDGRQLYKVYRATNAKGTYTESFPIGRNASPGAYTVRLASPIAGLTAETKVTVGAKAVTPRSLDEPARVFDEGVIRKFLATKPGVVIATGKDDQRPLADALAAKLNALGIKTTIKPQAVAIRKVAYPRVWDPHARLYRATGPEKKPGPVEVEVSLTLADIGAPSAKTKSGELIENWRKPLTLATVGPNGYLDWLGPHEFAYEPGCKLYVDAKNQVTVVKGELSHVETTNEFKMKWSRPWQRLMEHVGGYRLPPELPEAYTTDDHLILLGDSTSGFAVAALQASEIIPQVVDKQYPGPGRALVSFAWSPFAVEKNVILVGAADDEGIEAGIRRVVELAGGK
jgi:hypothetical protein